MLNFQVESTVSVVTEAQAPAETESNPPPGSAAETSPAPPTAPSPVEEEEEECVSSAAGGKLVQTFILEIITVTLID